MNNKIIIGVIIAAIILVVGVFVMNRSNGGLAPQSSLVVPTSQDESEMSIPSDDNQTEVVVTVTATGFTPQAATVKKGTKVIWENKSGKEANVSSANHPTHLVYPPLNLGTFADEENVSLTFDTTGSFKYHNHLEPAKTGTIIVE